LSEERTETLQQLIREGFEDKLLQDLFTEELSKDIFFIIWKFCKIINRTF